MINNEVSAILLAEDDPRDVELTLEALDMLGLAHTVSVAPNGVFALDYLTRKGGYADRPNGDPAVILLDIKMPRLSGLEVLRIIKNDERLKLIPTVLLTSSRMESDIVRGYRLGANAYVVKPVDYVTFVETVRELGSFWTLINVPPPESSVTGQTHIR